MIDLSIVMKTGYFPNLYECEKSKQVCDTLSVDSYINPISTIASLDHDTKVLKAIIFRAKNVDLEKIGKCQIYKSECAYSDGRLRDAVNSGLVASCYKEFVQTNKCITEIAAQKKDISICGSKNSWDVSLENMVKLWKSGRYFDVNGGTEKDYEKFINGFKDASFKAIRECELYFK